MKSLICVESAKSGHEEAKTKADLALRNHDDRRAAQFLMQSLGSPDPRLQAITLAELQLLFQRVRGAEGFRDFCELGLKHRLFSARIARGFKTLAELHLLAEDLTSGTATENQALQALCVAHSYHLEVLHNPHDIANKIDSLMIYTESLRLSTIVAAPRTLHRFCREKGLMVWAENSGKGCLLSVVETREVLMSDSELIMPVLQSLAETLRISLEMSPDDPDTCVLIALLIDQVSSDWSEALLENWTFLVATRAAVESLRAIEGSVHHKITETLSTLTKQIRSWGTLRPDSLIAIIAGSDDSGTMNLFRAFAKGQHALFVGDFAQAMEIFDRLHSTRALASEVRLSALQWSMLSAHARIGACSAFEFTPKRFLEDVFRRLRQLDELTEQPSLLTSKIFLDFTFLSSASYHPADSKLRTHREVLKQELQAHSEEECVGSEVLFTLIRSASFVNVQPADMLEELLSCVEIPVLRKMLEIQHGLGDLEVPPQLREAAARPPGDGDAHDSVSGAMQFLADRLPLAGLAQGGSNEATTVGPRPSEDLQWFREVLGDVSSEELEKELNLVYQLFVVPLDDAKDRQCHRIWNAELAFEVVSAFVRASAFSGVFELLEFTTRLAFGGSDAERELHLRTEGLRADVYLSQQQGEKAIDILTRLQRDLEDYTASRVTGELPMKVRNLVGHVGGQLSRLQGD